jgi:CRISPR system Cascade subunit CasA
MTDAPPSFDLTHEPWLPCLRLDGKREAVGLRDALLRAHEFRELRDVSPLVTVALHRLLLAIIHRVYDPQTLDDWQWLWRAGRFDPVPLVTYLDQWRERFDLFHPERPFYQDARLVDEVNDVSGVARLTTGTQPIDTLFDHQICPYRREEVWPILTAPEAARLLVAIQCYAISGGAGYRQTVLARGISFLPLGGNLFETLLLNTMPPEERGSEFFNRDSTPSWESNETGTNGNRRPRGYLDYLTAQSRRILFDATAEAGKQLIRHFRFKMGRTLELPEGCYEPTAAYRIRPAERALQFEAGRALWRDSHVLLHLRRSAGNADEFRGPAVIAFVQRLVADAILTDRTEVSLIAAGLRNENAKIFFWRLETLPLPLRSLTLDGVRQEVAEANGRAEQAAKHLIKAVKVVADYLLTAGTRSPDAAAVTKLADHLAPEPLYWSRLETPFRTFFRALAAAAGNDEAVARCQADWVIHSVRPAAERAFEESAGRIGTSARDLRAIAAGRDKLRRGLNKVCEHHRRFQNDEAGRTHEYAKHFE